MSLPDAYAGARHTGLEITWEHSDHTPYNLTDAVISAQIRNKTTGQSAAADGVFSILDAVAGLFTWVPGATDVGTVGLFSIQFRATYADESFDVSVPRDWRVVESF